MPRYYRKVIKIRAVDSPNVRLALAQQAAGRKPTGEVIVPGVLSWDEYTKRRQTWDEVRVCVGLDAEFYEGAQVLLYPPAWLNRAEQIADSLKGIPRQAKAMGIDPAEGGDRTVWAIVDELGLIHLLSLQTQDTAAITGRTIALMQEYNIPAGNVVFDRGGGGKQHADRLHTQGHKVRTVGFGEAVTPDPRYGKVHTSERLHNKEERYAYLNRRAEMYGELRTLLDPSNQGGFGLPAEYTELRRQLAPIPLWYDNEGRMYLPPKQKRTGDKDSSKVTIDKLVGHSPDEADALVLAVYGMRHKPVVVKVGAMW